MSASVSRLATPDMTTSRSLRRLDKLADVAVQKGPGTDERNLIVNTLLKILDECSDADYDIACREPLRAKLVTAGVIFDEESPPMSAVERIHELPLTPRDLALQLQAEACEPGGDLEWEERFAKLMEGRHKALRHAEHIEYAQFVADGKTPKALKKSRPVPNDLEKEAQRLERQARCIRLAGQVDAAAEKRVLMKIIMPNDMALGECTGDYVARIGGAFSKLGKRGATWLIKEKYSERDLEKAKIA